MLKCDETVEKKIQQESKVQSSVSKLTIFSLPITLSTENVIIVFTRQKTNKKPKTKTKKVKEKKMLTEHLMSIQLTN